MTQRTLALDDDDVRGLTLESGNNLVLDLAGTELWDERVERDAVLASLDQRRLPGADQDGPDPVGVQRLHEQRGSGALADRAVGAQDRDPGAGHIEDPAREQVQVPLVLGSPDVGDGDAGQRRRGRELGVVGEELVQTR